LAVWRVIIKKAGSLYRLTDTQSVLDYLPALALIIIMTWAKRLMSTACVITGQHWPAAMACRD